MKLGTETNSLVNHLSTGTRGQPTPVVGMGATILHWTDRSPATIIEVWSDKGYTWIKVQGDNYRRTDDNGMSECQSYEYTPNPEGGVSTYRHKEGQAWEAMRLNPETKRWNKSKSGQGLRIGEREKYHDFCF